MPYVEVSNLYSDRSGRNLGGEMEVEGLADSEVATLCEVLGRDPCKRKISAAGVVRCKWKVAIGRVQMLNLLEGMGYEFVASRDRYSLFGALYDICTFRKSGDPPIVTASSPGSVYPPVPPRDF